MHFAVLTTWRIGFWQTLLDLIPGWAAPLLASARDFDRQQLMSGPVLPVGVPPQRHDRGADDELPSTPAEDQADEPTDEVVVQQVMRIRDPQGRESIYATLRADFVPGQRYAGLHVAFAPAFATLPTIEVEAIEGPPAEVKLLQATHHGVQLEVRLDAAATQATYVTVELAAYPTPDAEVPA